MRLYTNDMEYGGSLTIIEIRDSLQNVAVSVENFWLRDSTRGIPARVQDDLGVDEAPGGDSLIQSLTESSSSRHSRRRERRVVINRIYTTR